MRVRYSRILGNFVCSNPYYVPPEEFLAPNHAEMEVKRLLANIRDREQTSKTLRKLSGRLFQMQDEEHRRIARETARLGRTGTRSGFYEPRRIAKADPRTGGIKEMTVGVGIAGMRERLRQVGGQLEIESSDRGTTVRAIVPLPRNGS